MVDKPAGKKEINPSRKGTEMKVIKNNIWKYHNPGYVVITTNGNINKNGECIMGKGIALEAKQRYPNLPYLLGQNIQVLGNHVFWYLDAHIITFPTKHNWRDKSSLELIEQSAKELLNTYVKALQTGVSPDIYMPKPGCGNGGLTWEEVEPVIEPYIGNIVTIVDR
jgi:hypothetical protein